MDLPNLSDGDLIYWMHILSIASDVAREAKQNFLASQTPASPAYATRLADLEANIQAIDALILSLHRRLGSVLGSLLARQ